MRSWRSFAPIIDKTQVAISGSSISSAQVPSLRSLWSFRVSNYRGDSDEADRHSDQRSLFRDDPISGRSEATLADGFFRK
jgi:hypothetical protein